MQVCLNLLWVGALLSNTSIFKSDLSSFRSLGFQQLLFKEEREICKKYIYIYIFLIYIYVLMEIGFKHQYRKKNQLSGFFIAKQAQYLYQLKCRCSISLT